MKRIRKYFSVAKAIAELVLELRPSDVRAALERPRPMRMRAGHALSQPVTDLVINDGVSRVIHGDEIPNTVHPDAIDPGRSSNPFVRVLAARAGFR